MGTVQYVVLSITNASSLPDSAVSDGNRQSREVDEMVYSTPLIVHSSSSCCLANKHTLSMAKE
jgi:hypothetical protein